MINRALLRTKAVQILYSAFSSNALDGSQVDQELEESIRWSENLYYCILSLPVELLRLVELERRRTALLGSEHPSSCPALTESRIVDNRVLRMLADNTKLNEEMAARELTLVWQAHNQAVAGLARRVEASDYFTRYCQADDSFNNDLEFVVNILARELSDNDDLTDALEEVNIYWNDDLNNAISFAIKTLGRFREARGAGQRLMPLWSQRGNQDKEYVRTLVRYTLLHPADLDTLIEPRLNGWDLDRISVIDHTLLRAAVAEMKLCPDTHVGIIINEYTELTRYYSADRSLAYVNAVLCGVAAELRPFETKKQEKQ